MEIQEVLENSKTMDASVSFCGNGSMQLSNAVRDNENPGDDILEDLDIYLEDINDRLTVSRMVSDSVIKAMVNAVEQEAAEKISQKELEVARLKEALRFYCLGVDENESSGSSAAHHDKKCINRGLYSSTLDTLLEHDRVRESLGSVRNAVEEELKKLRKDIDKVRRCIPLTRISSGSELVGLGGILREKVTEKRTDVDRTLDGLKTTLDTVYKQMDDMICCSKASISEWQKEQEFQEEIEAMVIRNYICSVQEEFEGRLWDHNARIYGNESTNWHEKMEEISNLRQELDAISKILSVPEVGQLTSHGLLEIGEEWSKIKMTDHFHSKVLSNHASSTSLSEGNGEHEESIIIMPELDPARLKHFSKDELMNYYSTEMTKMKRNHESKVQEMTEEYFSLKRKFLKERESSLPLKKDKEFDILRKKIPEVVSKLDDILVENEKLPFIDSVESLGSLKDGLNNLRSENCQLRDLLTDKKTEVKFLSSQISEAADKMLQHSITEASLLNVVDSLKHAIEDAHIECSIIEDVYKCLLREALGQIRCISEDSNKEYDIMQEIYEIIFKEAAQNAEPTNECEIEDSCMESIIIKELYVVLFREAFKEAKEKLNILHVKYYNESKIRVFFETEALEKEKALRLEVAEKKRLEKERHLLLASMEEKDKLILEAAAALAKEKEQFELASQELNNLRDHTNQQQVLISESRKELDQVKGNLVEVLKHIDSYKVEMYELNTKLELAMEELREADEERNMLHTIAQEKQNTLSLVEAKENEHKKKMESIIVLVHILSKKIAKFECRVAEDTKRNDLRLENLSSQLSSLIQKANTLRRQVVLHKQRLERKSSDLQKAEAEVDLLGDEVDTLLSLLEKIYIALDHYSPILHHYPGIMEILKMVRRELSGESAKPM